MKIYYFFLISLFFISHISSGEISFVVRSSSSMEKIFQNTFKEDWLRKGIDDEIEICAAKNERESVQAVIIPFVEIKNLKWDIITEKIKKENIIVQPVGYVYIPKNTIPHFVKNYPEEKIKTGYWPDPLFSTWTGIEKIDKEKIQPIWITIDIPKDLPSGNYVISINFYGEKTNKANFKIKLKVWDFTLPDTPTFKTGFWYAGDDFSSYYFTSDIWEIEKKFLKLVLENRITPINCDPLFSITYDSEDKSYSFDFTNFKRYLNFIFNENEKKGNLVNIVNHGWAYGFSSWNVKGYKGNFVLKPFTKEYEDFLIKYFTEVKKFLKENNWYDKAYIGYIDEPGPQVWKNCEWFYPIAKKVCPELPTVSAINYMPSVKELKNTIDIMVPGLFSIFKEENLSDFEKLQKEGRELWGYVCYKSSCIDYESIDHRIWTWICWKYNLKGFLYWGLFNWNADMWRPENKKIEEQLLRKDPKERWPYKAKWEPVLILTGAPGDGYLVYPSPEGDPWSSIRLENIRDGIEDYEYFCILKEKLEEIKKIDSKKYEEIIKEGEGLLKIEEDIIKSPEEYTRDWRKILERRRKIGDLIENIEKNLIGYKK